MTRSDYAKFGISFIWIALILDVLSPILALIRLSFDFSHINLLGIFGVVLWWFLTARVAAGSTWARIVYLLLTVLEILTVIEIVQLPGLAATVLGHGDLGVFIAYTKLILQVAGISILFATQGTSR